ncbi:MAG: hypothetical protein WDN01_20605 [Rhizomicrobium sp.]
MAGRRGESVDRRALMALAAGLAGGASAANAAAGGTRVIVDLGGVSLTDEIADAMELQIRRAVLMAVARAMPRTKFKSLPLPKGARGIVLARA